MLLPWVIGVAVVGIGEWVWYRWFDERMRTTSPGAARVVRIVIVVAAVVVAVGSIVIVVLTGEAGTRAVWGV
jgi:hypothetical protein